MKHAWVWVAWVGLAGACDTSDQTRDEARRVLAMYDAIDHRGPLSGRAAQVDALAGLPLHSPEVGSARDACVTAHRALLSAELSHEKAAAALESALSQRTDSAPLGVEVAERVRKEIEGAEQALGQARERFSPCEDQVRGLSLRFGARPGG